MKTAITSLVGIILVVGLTVLGIKVLAKNAPEAEKKTLVQKAPVVEVEVVRKQDLKFSLNSEGVVQTRRDTILSAQVAGRLIEVDPNFEVGATFQAGEIVAKIDPVDYRAAVAQAQSSLAEARLALVQEEARGEQAARDWRKIGGGKEASDLVLRLPFLESAKARVAAAVAGLEKATEDLARTEIRAPFLCRVRSVNLNLGAAVMPGAQLGTIYDPEQLIVRLPFSMDDFAQIPEESQISVSTMIGGQLQKWNAEMMWELGEVDQATLSAYILVRVLPRKNDETRFRLPVSGSFLNATLTGAVLPGVVGIPRSAVRGQDQVFVLNEEGRLEDRKVTVARRSAEQVFVTGGVSDGEKVILTKLEMPVPGMSLDEAEPLAEVENPETPN